MCHEVNRFCDFVTVGRFVTTVVSDYNVFPHPPEAHPMRRLLFAALVVAVAATVGFADLPTSEKFSDDGFVKIFDGKSLAGWTVSAKTGHSGATKNKSGGKWVVEDGAIVGSQDVPGNGGIVITDKQYGDFEVAFDMNNDFGPDSGLFLRSNDRGQAYQAMIDYHANGNLMGIYGEGIGGFLSQNYRFGKKVTDIVEETDKKAIPLPVKPGEWATFWKHGQWNELRARIEGNPAKITTWIKGVKFMEYTDTEKHLGDDGGIALQVHGGGDYTKQFVRYKNIRVKELKK